MALAIGAAGLYAQNLDSAVAVAGSELSNRLSERSTVAVITFQSTSARLSDYVIDELNGILVSIGRVVTVEGRQADMSGETSQSIGKKLGVRYTVSGSLETIGSQYRLRLQAVTTDTGAIVYTYSQNIERDATLTALLSAAPATVPAPQAAASVGANRNNTAPPAAPQTPEAAPQSGGYLADFTVQERWLATWLNPLFGLGSFAVEKDKQGGTRIALLEGAGILAMIIGRSVYSASLRTWEPSPAGLYVYYVGWAAYAGGYIYGIYRAWTFHRPGFELGAANIPWDIALVSDTNGGPALQLSYTVRW